MAERVKTLDFRSDTVTRPTPAMRTAMAEAEVGDDVYGEDPTVNRLQEQAALRLGMEAALFVPSGTMANQVALRTLGRPGDVVLAGQDAHLLLYESGAPWALSGLQVTPLGRGGLFEGSDVRRAVHPSDAHYAPTTIVAVENTHNRSGGRVFPLDLAKDVAAAARDAGLALHLDGARLFNAEAATGTPAAEWAGLFDTVSFCLSKGLGAPVGSLVCGSRERLRALHRALKLLGGGMRQAGVLAAAGLHALEHHVARLADDHANARRLAAGLAGLGLRVDPAPETNMVLFDVDDGTAFSRALGERALRINPIAPGRYRAVTHLDVSEADVDDALGRIEEIVRGGVR
ncbi:MAG: threonine aldolase family protein [Myxococcota bacterium]